MNFGVVFKQTFKSTFSKVSTSVSIILYFTISALLLIMVPLIALDKQAGPKIFSDIYLQSMFYSISLMLSLFISICAVNANEMAEMTFIISRPVSRKVFITAKSLCSICMAMCFLIWTIILFVIYEIIFKGYGYDPFINSDHANWATVIIPNFLVVVYSVYLPYFLRTFFSDKIITLFLALTAIATYQIYTIVTAVTQKGFDPLYGYLIIPSCVYGIGGLATIVLSFITIQKVTIKV